MSTWTMFKNGLATQLRYSGPLEWLAANTPAGHEAVMGDFAVGAMKP